MIDLLREASALFLVWCIGLTMTYGIVESVLMLPFRVIVSAMGGSGWLGESLVYCPVCSGFWCFGVAGACSYHDPWWFLRMAVIGVTSLLFARAMKADLVIPHEDVEEDAIVRLRARKAS